MVDLGGTAPPSWIPFSVTVYAVLYIIYLFGIFVNRLYAQIFNSIVKCLIFLLGLFVWPYGLNIAERLYSYLLPCRNHIRPIRKMLVWVYLQLLQTVYTPHSRNSVQTGVGVVGNKLCAIRIFRFDLYQDRNTFKYPYVRLGGSRTHIQNTFLSASYSNNLQYIFVLIVCQSFVLRWQLATMRLFWDLNSSRFWALACSHSAWVLYLACSPDSGTGPSTLNDKTQIKVRTMTMHSS